MYNNMALLIHNLSKSSRRCLQPSYRMIYNTTSYQQIDTSISQDDTTNDDLPIVLERNPYERERTKCILCTFSIEPDYKNVRLLSQFQSSYTGRIYGRNITGLCMAKQAKVEREILKAQNCGLMAVYHKSPQYLQDPQLFDPNHPFRPHNY